MKYTGPLISLAACVAATCRAANPTPLPESLLACTKFQDPMERVRCYDSQIAALNPAAFAAAKPAVAAPPVAVSPAPVIGTPMVVPSVAAPMAAAPVAAAPAASATSVPAQATSPAQFGEEQLPSKSRPAAPPKEEALLSSITSIRTVGQKIYLISLANGQVWRQEGSQLPALFKAGNEARIERGAFGSYHLSIASFGAKNWVLVTRTQ